MGQPGIGGGGGGEPDKAGIAPLRDRAILLLVSGQPAEQVEVWLQQFGGAAPELAQHVVAVARQRITLAADFARDEQLGLAVRRLEDLYGKSLAGKDVRTALQSQRELNRLLGLYSFGEPEAEPAGDSAPELSRQLQLIADHLVPLGLTDAGYPVEEHARIAAQVIRHNGFV